MNCSRDFSLFCTFENLARDVSISFSKITTFFLYSFLKIFTFCFRFLISFCNFPLFWFRALFFSSTDFILLYIFVYFSSKKRRKKVKKVKFYTKLWTNTDTGSNKIWFTNTKISFSLFICFSCHRTKSPNIWQEIGRRRGVKWKT